MCVLPSVLSSPFSLPHIGTRAQRIRVSYRPSSISLVCTLDTCVAYTCQFRSHSHTCTGIQRSWWCCVWKIPCNPRTSGRCSDNRTHDRRIQGTILPVAVAWVLFFSLHHILHYYHCHRHRRHHYHPRNYFRSRLSNLIETVRPCLKYKI